MDSIGDLLVKALEGYTAERPSSEVPDRLRQLMERVKEEQALSPEEKQKRMVERAQATADEYNRTPGTLKDGYYTATIQSDRTFVEGDGYDCPLCLNRGDTMHIRETGTGIFQYCTPCKCMEIRRSIWRMKASGLEKSIRENTFKTFEAQETWQQKMLDMARKYLSEGWKEGRWMFMGGQPGCGKTHICTAVAGKLLYERPVIYAVWPQISKKLKAIVNEADEYGMEVSKLQEIPVLYIDDFFKPVSGEDKYGNARVLPPTPADLKLAFEILNYRYINKLPTILSSEWHLAELADMDEATASRIAERCGEYAMQIGRDRKRNHRFAGGTVV